MLVFSFLCRLVSFFTFPIVFFFSFFCFLIHLFFFLMQIVWCSGSRCLEFRPRAHCGRHPVAGANVRRQFHRHLPLVPQ